MRTSRYNEKEAAIYDFITRTIEEEGYSPTVRDIQQALGIKSTSTVHAYLARLEEKGLIRKDPGKSRTINTAKTSPSGERVLRVPILGQVRAGMPILAVENHEDYLDFPVPRGGYRREELFSLRVTGDSMIEAGILPGDLLVVRQTPSAENGDIVVALIEDGATVKTFYKENGHFRLQPENASLSPILVDEVTILGKVIANLRFY